MESLAMTDADFAAELSETEQATAKAESLVSDGDSDAEVLPDMESLLTFQAKSKARAIEEKFGELIRNPALAETYPFDTLMGHEWVWLLCEAPQFGDRCKWDVLDGTNWRDLLLRRPEFADKCDWRKLRRWDWGQLLKVHPEFAAEFDVVDSYVQSSKDHVGPSWGGLLMMFPELASLCDKFDGWSEIPCESWLKLLMKHPEFAEKCRCWDEFEIREIYFLVRRMPELKPHFSPDKLREVDKISIKDIPKLIKHTR